MPFANKQRTLRNWLKKCRNALPFNQPKLAPKEIFSRFQKVLASNNKALEIIADLGEKGSGDFIFDQAYITSSLKKLHTAVTSSIAALNSLCNNRFSTLNDVAETVWIELEKIQSGKKDSTGPTIQKLSDITQGDWGLVGGKAGHLAELIAELGDRVPDGFVITSSAFHQTIKTNGLQSHYEAFCSLLAEQRTNDSEMEKHRNALVQGLLNANPPDKLLNGIAQIITQMTATNANPFRFAVRSSAPEEDQEFSFAGQFHSELDVSPTPEAIFSAFRLVAASLFSKTVIAYHSKVLPGDSSFVIAACCQQMVSSTVSGVAYSLDPGNPLTESIIVTGAWGLGASVVEGQIATDTFSLSKTTPPTIISQQINIKEQGLYFHKGEGHKHTTIPPNIQKIACLNPDQLIELGQQIIQLENRFRRPLDIEWTFDSQGTLYILQVRPLRIPSSSSHRRMLSTRLAGYEQICKAKGTIAQQGIGSGPVYIVNTTKDLETFPDNAVLVSRRDSSRFVSVMHRAAAILTETGTTVSHMATLCRELQVPCIVGIDGLMNSINSGELITVDAEDARIFKGRVVELLAYRASSGMQLATGKEFRTLRQVLKKVSLLNLVDPLLKNFTVDGCRTYHDILRFAHEKAAQTLINAGRDETGLLKQNLARHLDLPVPVGIIVIDIGGGITVDAPKDRVTYQSITSEPFKAVLQGMLFPDVWHMTSMKVGLHDLMSSMLSAPIAAIEGSYTGHNIAIIGANYVNLCFRLGYHFNIIDAYCGERERDNHIYFRFLGGASDVSKRTRRAMLIEKILIEFDFRIKIKGDMVIARHGSLCQSDMTRILDILGRLVGFTRQLDVKLDSDKTVDYYAEAFLMGDYGIVSTPVESTQIPGESA